MSEVIDVTEAIQGRAHKTRVRKAIRYAFAALVGAAALAAVANKVKNSDTPEQV